jgi:hypothetical protein
MYWFDPNLQLLGMLSRRHLHPPPVSDRRRRRRTRSRSARLRRLRLRRRPRAASTTVAAPMRSRSRPLRPRDPGASPGTHRVLPHPSVGRRPVVDGIEQRQQHHDTTGSTL